MVFVEGFVNSSSEESEDFDENFATVAADSTASSSYTADEEKVIADRLRSLGYID